MVWVVLLLFFCSLIRLEHFKFFSVMPGSIRIWEAAFIVMTL